MTRRAFRIESARSTGRDALLKRETTQPRRRWILALRTSGPWRPMVGRPSEARSGEGGLMKRLVMLMLLAALALSLPVAASTFIHMDQKALVRDSASVIQGRVISTSSYWNETGQVIVTDALIQVED